MGAALRNDLAPERFLLLFFFFLPCSLMFFVVVVVDLAPKLFFLSPFLFWPNPETLSLHREEEQ